MIIEAATVGLFMAIARGIYVSIQDKDKTMRECHDEVAKRGGTGEDAVKLYKQVRAAQVEAEDAPIRDAGRAAGDMMRGLWAVVEFCPILLGVLFIFAGWPYYGGMLIIGALLIVFGWLRWMYKREKARVEKRFRDAGLLSL